MLDGYLTSDEAAAHLGITRRTLYNLAASRDDFPKPARIGRTLLWPTDGLDDWRTRHPARRKVRDSPALWRRRHPRALSVALRHRRCPVMTVEEYAIDLVCEGAEHVAEDDLNEDGEIADDLHQEACDLAIKIAHAIRANPNAVLALVGR